MISKSFLEQIRISLNVKQLQATGQGGGGCINEGAAYTTENGKIFIKYNAKEGAKLMLDGEVASLLALQATNTIRVPSPQVVLEEEGRGRGTVMVMEWVEMGGGSAGARHGQQLARLHLHNRKQANSSHNSRVGAGSAELNTTAQAGGAGQPGHVEKFGFDVPTCCGFLPQDNTWCDNWPEFYARRLDEQIARLPARNKESREASELWQQLQRAMPLLLRGTEEVLPALLHGDLWGGNISTMDQGEPVVFDPASFYGHSEFDLAIAAMFGGFSGGFWSAYFEELPKQQGWEQRHQLYQLFHYLNHWNHFGGSYARTSINIMKDLIK